MGLAMRSANDRLKDGRSSMDKNPFLETESAQDSLSNRRRTTRVEFVTPVYLSGRDAAGQTFRELTQTVTVNLHGCKLRTSYRVIVGMLVTLECPKTGMTGKAVCVKVWDTTPGVPSHEIAVQLIKPQNMWGLANPPADWEIVAKTLVQGRTVQPERPGRVPSPLPPATPSPVTPKGTTPVPPVVAPPAEPERRGTQPSPSLAPVAPARTLPVFAPSVDQRLAELERRATQLMGSVLEIMRTQAEELTRTSLEEFRQQIDVLIHDAEMRLREGVMESYQESASALINLRTDLTDQMTSRQAQLLRSAEEALRARALKLMDDAGSEAPLNPTEQPSKK